LADLSAPSGFALLARPVPLSENCPFCAILGIFRKIFRLPLAIIGKPARLRIYGLDSRFF
jgi:hypothetical protein